jgi:cold shock CspA family protein
MTDQTASGTVATFDDHRGYGTVRADDGRELFFHCTAVADGTRSIEVGAAVTFAVVPGRLGRWEATDLRPGAPAR